MVRNKLGMKKRGKEKRGRKIIWFNPPFPLSEKTNIGKRFFKMLKTTSLKQTRYKKYSIRIP